MRPRRVHPRFPTKERHVHRPNPDNAGLLTIELTDITEEQTNASIGALVKVLSELDEPIELESAAVYVQETADDTPATLHFRYFGSGNITLKGLEAYASWMNENLALIVYMCATDVRETDDDHLEVDFHSFELKVDKIDAPVVAVH